MKYLKLTLLLFFFIQFSQAQDFKPTSQTDNSLNFTQFLNGVKKAYIGLDEEDVNYIRNNPNSGNASVIAGLLTYLEAIGFDDVQWGVISSNTTSPSICDVVTVVPLWNYQNSLFTNITLNFISCNQDIFSFKAPKNIGNNGYIATNFHNLFMKMYGRRKGAYLVDYRYQLKGEKTDWTESRLKSHFKENGVDLIEGIYESSVENKQMPKYKVGILKSNDGYNVIYISGSSNYLDWKEGEIKANLYPTATTTLFKADWRMTNKSINKNLYLTFEKGLMNLIAQDDKTLFIKLYPTSNDNIQNISVQPSSGTGFAISSDGLIVTNYHVVNGAKSIKIRGINGDFTKFYTAKIIIEDKNNDLSIIKIDDINFKSLETIPFTISTKNIDVGSSVFVMGYPLRATMGDEIKLTNGIVSSKSGFQGDVTTYQISAPVQPGNSGGPLFDNRGNLIGIINARHSSAENASYAIKSSYLLNLVDIISVPVKLQTVSAVLGKTLPEQVKILKKFTYIIEIN